MRGSPSFDSVVVAVVEGIPVINAGDVRKKELPSHANVIEHVQTIKRAIANHSVARKDVLLNEPTEQDWSIDIDPVEQGRKGTRVYEEDEEDVEDVEGVNNSGDIWVEEAISRGYIHSPKHFKGRPGLGASMNRLQTEAIRGGTDPDDLPGSVANPDCKSYYSLNYSLLTFIL